MPKFTSVEGRESYDEKIRDRKNYCAEHYVDALPRASEDEIPKAVVFRRATKLAGRNGLNAHPYFRGSKTRFLSYLKNHFSGVSGIRQIALDKYGCATDFGHGLNGIRRAGKRGAELTAAWLAGVLQVAAETQKLYAGSVRRLLNADAPSLQMKLFRR